MRKFSRKATVLTVVAGVLLTAGIAFAWVVTGNGTGSATSSQPNSLLVTVLDQPSLSPGVPKSLTIRVANPNDFNVNINDVVGAVTSDNNVACPPSSVTFTYDDAVRPVGANATVDFAIPAALMMAADAPDGCQGRAFTIQLQVIAGTA